MNARQWKAEVEAAFRAIYGCSREETPKRTTGGGRHIGACASYVTSHCIRCGVAFRRKSNATRQVRCAPCQKVRNTERNAPYVRAFRARRRAAKERH